MIATLETQRLLLTPLDESCFSTYEAFYTDGNASQAYGGPISRAAVWSRLKADLGSWYLQGFGVWAIQEKKHHNVIGTCGFGQSINNNIQCINTLHII